MNKARKATILSISLTTRTFDEILNILDENANTDCDLIQLPEFCLGSAKESILAMDSEEFKKVGAVAKKHSKYIVFPVYRKTEYIKRLNTAILFDRKGNIAGIYDKLYPYWEEFDFDPPVVPGEKAPVFDTDFGRIAIAICFDANYTNIWKTYREKGVDLVLWSSAYSGGRSLQAHATNYNYYIISATYALDCHVFDITGEQLFYGKSADSVGVFKNEVDLSRRIFHQDFNVGKKLENMLEKHTGEIEKDKWCENEGWYTLRAIKEGVDVRTLAKEHNMEELSAYKIRSEMEIDQIRGTSIYG